MREWLRESVQNCLRATSRLSSSLFRKTQLPRGIAWRRFRMVKQCGGSNLRFERGISSRRPVNPSWSFFVANITSLSADAAFASWGQGRPDTGAPPRPGRQNGARWKLEGLTPAMVEREGARPSKSGSVWIGSQGARSDTGRGSLTVSSDDRLRVWRPPTLRSARVCFPMHIATSCNS